jgi:DNA polymerase-3 subunit delta'
MSFARFPAQQPVVSLLQRSLENGRLAHAYLFSGDDLAEMEGLARVLAKTLNCLNPPLRSLAGQALDCCDECLNCRRIDHNNHPDVLWVRPESKLRLITIDQIRECIQTISLKPAEAAYKFAILSAADRMNSQAANAFLKTLEEPPARSVIVLLTTSLEQVLETILSRCLRLHFAGSPSARLSPEDQTWLESLTRLASAPKKSLIGRYRMLSEVASRLAAIKDSTSKEFEAASPLSRYPDAEKSTQDKWEDELNAAVESEYRRKRSELILLLQWWMRDIWLATLKAERGLAAFPVLKSSTDALASRISREDAAENLHTLERLQRQLGTNVQETLAFEIGLLKLRL